MANILKLEPNETNHCFGCGAANPAGMKLTFELDFDARRTRGSFAIGPAALQRRVRDELGLDYTLGQVESLALGEIERVGKLLEQAAAVRTSPTAVRAAMRKDG